MFNTPVLLILAFAAGVLLTWMARRFLYSQSEFETFDMPTYLRDVRIAAEEKQREFVASFDFVSDCIWDVDLKTGHAMTSDSWIRSLGYNNVEDFRTLRSWEAMLHPEDRPVVNAMLSDLLQGHIHEYECEQRFLTSTGAIRWRLCRGALQKDAYGNPTRFVGMHHDIQQRKMAELAAERHLESEKRLSRLKSDFVVKLSHALRTPLTVLVSSRALLGVSLDSGVITRDTLHRYLRQMDSSLHRLRRLAEDALSYIQVETTMTDPHIGLVDIGQLVSKVWNEVDSELVHEGSGNATYQLVLSDVPANVALNEVSVYQLLKQVFSLLKRESPEAVSWSIALAQVDQTHISIQITQTSTVPTASIQNTLFESESASRHIPSANDELGWAIIEGLAQQLGGNADVSLDDNGRRACITIPTHHATCPEGHYRHG